MKSISEILNGIKILKILLFDESRKVGFGLWLFIAACLLLWRHVIVGDQWMDCMIMCSILIGGGTVSDKWMATRGGKYAPSVDPEVPKT
jgi:hypothetical protein